MSTALIAFLVVFGFDAEIQSAPEAHQSVVDSINQTIRAKKISLANPIYPRVQLNNGREAWVHVTYCIDESGEIQNISVLDSTGNSEFDKAAMKAVKRFEYEPASRDGSPVWQSRNEVYVKFSIENAELGASDRFIRRHRRIAKLIDEQNLEEADELFQDAYDNFDLTLYELGKLWAQRVRYEALVGDVYRLNMALHRATASHGDFIDVESYAKLLGLRAQVELALGKYHEAIHSYEDLVDATTVDSEEVVALAPAFENLRAMIEDRSAWQINAEIRQRGNCAFCNDSWDFTPVRNDFSFAHIAGRLDSIDMRCDHKRFESNISDQVEWYIPESWGTCHIQVYGEPGTTFVVTMLPSDDA